VKQVESSGSLQPLIANLHTRSIELRHDSRGIMTGAHEYGLGYGIVLYSYLIQSGCQPISKAHLHLKEVILNE